MNVNWHTTRENMVYGEENSLQFRTHGITRASHQISQSTYSLLFFKGRAGYESKSLVEWTRKNKTELQKVLVFVHVGLLMEHETTEAWGDLQELLQLQHHRDRGMLMFPWTTMMWMLTPGILQHFTCNDGEKNGEMAINHYPYLMGSQVWESGSCYKPEWIFKRDHNKLERWEWPDIQIQ